MDTDAKTVDAVPCSEPCNGCDTGICLKEWHLVCPACWERTPKPMQDELVAALAEAVAAGGPNERHLRACEVVVNHLRDN